MTLTEFLLAQIAEDEETAQLVIDERPASGFSRSAHAVANLPDTLQAFVLQHGPFRVKAECEAKRRIVEQYIKNPQPNLYLALCALAAPYADHPDYRDEWGACEPHSLA